MFHHAVHFAFVFFVLKRLPFVVGVLALAESYLQFGSAVFVNKEPKRNDGFPRFFGLPQEFLQFFFMQKQFAVALGDMVVASAQTVFRNMHTFHLQFILIELAVGVSQRGFAFSDTFYLCTKQLQTCRVAVKHFILKPCLFVFNIYICLSVHKFFVRQC